MLEVKMASGLNSVKDIERLQRNALENQDVKKIKDLSEEFESLFLEIMLKSMRDSVEKSGLVDGGNAENIFQGMLDKEYSKKMSSQRSSGIADAIESHLLGLRNQENISKKNILLNYQGAKPDVSMIKTKR
tara:strand:+ start:402 stop:794 length:393 start_codon:yes stop_codon:yes gene_type:complete